MPRRSLILLVGLLAAFTLCLAVSSVAVPWYAHESLVSKVGSYAPVYLFEPSTYNRLVVEVHYGEAPTPSDAALRHLQTLLSNATGKTVVVREYADIGAEEVPSILGSGEVTVFGNSMIKEHAISRTGLIGGDAVIYIFYVNATAPEPKLSKGNRVGGVSYRGDSFVIFKNNIRDDGEEKTVLIHEAGHLLGLDHDEDQQCAMVGSLIRVHRQNYTSPSPDDYCADHWRELKERQHKLPLDELLGSINIPVLR
ncbi:M12 family metallo-peptidase [Methanocella sp. MCL-LM]|uniref:M12 family metallo-peptidase n=1 Tax=Methanocella sp. MCL-LM TaxID=3412035 RepID=UPI003C73BE80